MDRFLQEIVNWTRKTDEQILIGISGHGAAGKTTFANKLATLLNENEVNYMNTDPYMISSEVRKHAVIDYTYQNENHCYKMTAYHPSAHHLHSLERDVQMVRDGLDEVFMHPFSQRFDIIIKTFDEAIYLVKNTFEFKCE